MRETPMRPVPNGLETIEGETLLARHRHNVPFAALVLDGSYEECGDAGRFTAVAGDVLIHRAFEAHRDSVARSGVRILNLAYPTSLNAAPRWRVRDPDAIARMAERDLQSAMAMLTETAIPHAAANMDWPDMLAADLRNLGRFSLSAWAETHGLSPESVSRGFRAAFGIAPQCYRAEARARAAIVEVMEHDSPLAAVAADLGFSDQAHMTRAVRAMSGITPSSWRRSAIAAC